MAENKGYSVGYKKPPQHTQFKPGQSGNRNGRPKKEKKVVDFVLKEVRSFVNVTLGSERQRISKLEAIVKQQVNKAAGGDLRSATMIPDMVKPVESDQGDHLHELLQEFREKNARHIDSKQGRPTHADGSNVGTSPTDETRKKS
jgi:Family of unknown function (DUF5681)